VAAGARVVDFASGSGLVAIAAARAGARHVTASDLDPFAVAAIRLNAAANGVEGRITPVSDNLLDAAPEADLVLAADVFYERDLAAAVTAWLFGLQARGATILIGDPGRTYLPQERLECLETYTVPVSRSLEDSEIKRSHVWRLRP
jgi:predicted nicotinamide N-methyase